ncbi:hypothetical protein K402DRAFT_90042 [Aulographum hederae CBS 113979]|uniref:Uncharacterized protein n=1 Tax=Aulographum hederae CBS 113979 TaxID=1176131 RepID=A0A6G1GYQ5_9PEZI|nr:hypothetical protein K402DRAFT_90042 [Aulographum hederae CBS 113979]
MGSGSRVVERACTAKEEILQLTDAVPVLPWVTEVALMTFIPRSVLHGLFGTHGAHADVCTVAWCARLWRLIRPDKACSMGRIQIQNNGPTCRATACIGNWPNSAKHARGRLSNQTVMDRADGAGDDRSDRKRRLITRVDDSSTLDHQYKKTAPYKRSVNSRKQFNSTHLCGLFHLTGGPRVRVVVWERGSGC